MDVHTCIEKFIATAIVERNLSEKTLAAYQGDLLSFNHVFEGRRIEEITTDDIRSYIEEMETNNCYKDSTIKRKIATLKVFFNFAEQEDIVIDSPTRKIRRRYIIAKHLPKVLSTREIQRLLRVAYEEVCSLEVDRNNRSIDFPTIGLVRAYRDRVAFELLFMTGIRISELAALNNENINLADRTILVFGKGRKERIIYIPSDEVVDIIRKYLVVRRKIPSNSNALLLNKYGTRLSIFSIENIFDKYCKKAGIKNHYTPHCLRHTMATMLLSNGANIRVVQEILGHTSIVTTQIYTEISQNHRKKELTRCHPRNWMKLSK